MSLWRHVITFCLILFSPSQNTGVITYIYLKQVLVYKLYFIFRIQNNFWWYINARPWNRVVKWSKINFGCISDIGQGLIFWEEKKIFFFSSDLSTRMYGTMAISTYTDYFSLQKVNWDNLFNVCRPKKNKRYKGNMNGVQNIEYAWHFRWRMLNLSTRWIVYRTWICWLASKSGLYKQIVSASYSQFLKQTDATCNYSENTECIRYIEMYEKIMGTFQVKVPQWQWACRVPRPSGLA